MSRRATRRATRETTNLLTTTPDDVALGIAWALCRTTTPNAIGTQPTEGRSNVSTTAAADLCRLARACRRFSSKHCWVVGGRAAVSTVAEADASMWSIVEEAAWRWLAEDCGEQERGWVALVRVLLRLLPLLLLLLLVLLLLLQALRLDRRPVQPVHLLADAVEHRLRVSELYHGLRQRAETKS
jgi:hypothetical protein